LEEQNKKSKKYEPSVQNSLRKRKQMADIILVHPNSGVWQRMNLRLPLSLMHIAGPLEQAGFSVKIVDQRVEKRWRDILKNELKEKPLFIGITSMTGTQIKHALEVSWFVKTISDSTVVWGGVHVSLLPEQTLHNPAIDIGIIGEGEITAVELAQAMANNSSLSHVKGIVYKQNDEIIRTPARGFLKNLDILPPVPYHLVNTNFYNSFGYKGEKSLDIVTSKGCPFKCIFCYNTVYNQSKWRAFSAERTVEEIERVVKDFNINNIYFQDDNFCADLNRVEKIASLIIKKRLKIKFGVMGVRVDTLNKVDDCLLKALFDAGCINLDVGVESGSNRILSFIRKGITVDNVLEVNERIKKFPFIIKYTFIIGFPGEKKTEIKETIQLAKTLSSTNRRAYTPFYVATPYPGTELSERAKEYGFKPPENLEGWQSFNRDTWYLNNPSWLTKKDINELKMVTFISFLWNKNITFKITKRLYRILFYIYYPIARFRMTTNFYRLPLELRFENILNKFS